MSVFTRILHLACGRPFETLLFRPIAEETPFRDGEILAIVKIVGGKSLNGRIDCFDQAMVFQNFQNLLDVGAFHAVPIG